MHPLVPRYLEQPTAEQLAEIYRLRVTAWMPDPNFDARQFSNGLVDELDSTAHHWIIKDSHQIIAAARVAVVKRLTDLSNWQVLSQCLLPEASPVALFSRLVVHPHFQGRGHAKQLDAVRIAYIDRSDIPLTISLIDDRRTQALNKLGFVEAGLADNRYHFYKSTTYIYYRLHPQLKLDNQSNDEKSTF